MTIRPMMLLALALTTAVSGVWAQTPTPAKAPPNETLEPAVDTSAPSELETSKNSTSEAPAQGTKPAPDKPKPAARNGKALDHLELDTTDITGNRELPKVLYIVPWKRSDLGDLLGKPVNSLLDEVLEPVDRDVFKRENRYYRALQPDAAAATPGSTAAPTPAH